jgi:threonine/homoserine/homoserine lactone efflux protein
MAAYLTRLIVWRKEIVMFPWLPFLSYTVIMSFTPGPINILSMNNGRSIGWKNGILFNLGNYIGHFTVMLVCLAFAKILYALIPKIQLPMRILAAAYLLYLIFRTIAAPRQRAAGDSAGRGSFLLGIALQLVNVKVILFGLTAWTSYLLPYIASVPALMLFAALMSSIQLLGNITWTLFGSVMSGLFKNHKAPLNIIITVMLLYCVVRLFV